MMLPLEGPHCCIIEPRQHRADFAGQPSITQSYLTVSIPFAHAACHTDDVRTQHGQRICTALSSDTFTFDGELLHSAPLSSAAVRWQAEAADAAACSDAGAQDIVGVQVVAAL